MSLPSAATSFDGGATYYYGGGGSPPFSLVYFLVRLSLLLLLWLLQSSRHDEIRKLLLGRRRRRRRRSSTAASLRANTRKLHGMKSWSWHFSRFDSIPTIYIYSISLFQSCLIVRQNVFWKSNIALVEKPIWYITRGDDDSSGKLEMMFHIWWKTPASPTSSSSTVLLFWHFSSLNNWISCTLLRK